jgi:iron complex transport system ATP-binding protein
MRISARAVSLRLGSATVLDRVDMDVSGGDLVGLIGPNGAGKTSLLRLLAGLLSPGGGDIAYDGRDLPGLPLPERARRVAYLAQGDTVHWPIGVVPLVALGRLPHRGSASPDADRAAVERALEMADVVEFRDRTLDTLSGGERARVLLARALAVEAPVLLADEPIAALDPYHQLQIMELLRAAAGGGTGVVAVLHDLALAHRFCDRLVLIAHGRKIADGPPDEVLTDANLATAYGIAVRRGDGYILPWTRLEKRS